MPDAARSTRILHLLSRPPDFQTERALEAITRGDLRDEGAAHAVRGLADPAHSQPLTACAAPPSIDVARIGSGGRWSNRLRAILGLRNRLDELDVIHCWDSGAL